MKMVRMSVPASTKAKDGIMKTVSIKGLFGFWRKMIEKGEKGPERWWHGGGSP